MTRLRVPPDAAGVRLDRFLAELPEIGSRAVAERLVREGGVRVDGRVRPKSHKLESGEEVEFEAPAPRPSGLEPQELELVVPYVPSSMRLSAASMSARCCSEFASSE